MSRFNHQAPPSVTASALAGWLLPRKVVRPVDPGVQRIERVVRALLARPLVVIAVAVTLVAGGLFALRDLGSELLPPSDPRQFSVRLVGRPGQRVESTARSVEAVEQTVSQVEV